MPLTAIVRPPGPRLAEAEITHIARGPIDVALARRQHASYAELLRVLGCDVVEAPASDEHPDAVFVEDTAVAVPGLAVLTRPGAPSRRGEVPSMADVLSALAPRVERLTPPARLDGGDVLRLEDTLYVGRSTRTDDAGVAALVGFVEPVGYRVVAVPVDGVLHLKTGVTALPDGSLLTCGRVDLSAFEGREVVRVPEPSGANVLLVGAAVVVAASAPRTAELVRRRGHDVHVVDISELEAAEAGLTCLSVLVPSVP